MTKQNRHVTIYLCDTFVLRISSRSNCFDTCYECSPKSVAIQFLGRKRDPKPNTRGDCHNGSRWYFRRHQPSCLWLQCPRTIQWPHAKGKDVRPLYEQVCNLTHKTQHKTQHIISLTNELILTSPQSLLLRCENHHATGLTRIGEHIQPDPCSVQSL